MEILAEIVGFLVFEVLFAAVGWVCLFAWYRNRKKVQEMKDRKYAGDYSAAGRVMFLNLIAGIGAITMFGIVIFFLGGWIYKLIAN